MSQPQPTTKAASATQLATAEALCIAIQSDDDISAIRAWNLFCRDHEISVGEQREMLCTLDVARREAAAQDLTSPGGESWEEGGKRETADAPAKPDLYPRRKPTSAPAALTAPSSAETSATGCQEAPAYTPYLAQSERQHRDNFVSEIRRAAGNWELPEHAIEALACVASDIFFAAFAQSKEDGHYCLESTAGLAHAAAPELLAALNRLQANPNDPRAHRQALDAIAKATLSTVG